MTIPQAFDGNVWHAVILAAMFFPSLVAIIRGARKNHLGGILVLNAASIAPGRRCTYRKFVLRHA